MAALKLILLLLNLEKNPNKQKKNKSERNDWSKVAFKGKYL